MERLELRENPIGQSLVLATIAMLSLGVVMVHSALASVTKPGEWYVRVDVRHTVFAVLAGVVLCTVWRFDYHRLGRGRQAPVIPAVLLGVAILSSVVVLIPGIGHHVGGDRRWLRLPEPMSFIGFQPSELIKLTLVLFLACWLVRKDEKELASPVATFLPALALVGLCMGLVISEDFGTAVIIGMSAGVAMLLAGVPLRHLLSLLPLGAGAFYFFVICTPRRWARITAMMDPWAQSDTAYQPGQSLLAILTGGWFGRGPGNGVIKLGYLPEDTTDFIFAVFCEEWGFVGACLLIGLLLVWIWQARRSAIGAGDSLGRVLAGSMGFLIAVQAVLHIAVDLVAVPPTGMGFPFVSAGGTALLMMAAAAAIIISVTAHPGQASTGAPNK